VLNPHGAFGAPERATLSGGLNAMQQDKKGTKILARTFFTQLRTGGYTPNQILDIATELIDLVTTDMKEMKVVEEAQKPEFRQTA
jgi:hypothetical protein